MDSVRVRWDGGRRFIATDAIGHTLEMDAPEPTGAGSGVRPIEMVLYALGGCTGIDVVGILGKQRQDVRDFEIVVTGDQREEQPRRYEWANIEYIVTGVAIRPAMLERAIQLSEERYCSVRAMFDPAVRLSSSYRIVEAD